MLSHSVTHGAAVPYALASAGSNHPFGLYKYSPPAHCTVARRASQRTSPRHVRHRRRRRYQDDVNKFPCRTCCGHYHYGHLTSPSAARHSNSNSLMDSFSSSCWAATVSRRRKDALSSLLSLRACAVSIFFSSRTTSTSPCVMSVRCTQYNSIGVRLRCYDVVRKSY